MSCLLGSAIVAAVDDGSFGVWLARDDGKDLLAGFCAKRGWDDGGVLVISRNG